MAVSDIVNRITTMMNEIPVSEQKVGQAVLDHTEFTVKATVSELAKRANTSTAAVIRFCKSIGFESFPDFKRELALALVGPFKTGYYDIESDETPASIGQKLLSNTMQALHDTVGSLSEETFIQAYEYFANADTIFAYGVGASWLIAEDVMQKWTRTGKNVYITQDRHLMATRLASDFTENALFLGVSNKGETAEVIELARIAQEHHIPVISLTRFGPNTLKQYSDLALETARAPEAEIRTSATSSRQAQLLIIDILYCYYASQHFEKMLLVLDKTHRATAPFRYKQTGMD